MRPFKIDTTETASPETQAIFDDKLAKLGFIPNIFTTISESPPVLQAFDTMNSQFSDCCFTATERETIELVTSVENGCGYCVAGHTAFAAMQNVPDDVVSAIRNGDPIADPRLSALAKFTRNLIYRRGKVSQYDLVHFFDAGFTPRHVIEVILGISLKTLTNYVSNATSISLDPAFEPYKWQEHKKTPLSAL